METEKVEYIILVDNTSDDLQCKACKLAISNIPKDSILHVKLRDNIKFKQGNSIVILLDCEYAGEIIDYIISPTLLINDIDLARELDYWGLYHMNNYSAIYGREKIFKDNLYNPSFENAKFNTDSYYNLITLSQLIEGGVPMYDSWDSECVFTDIARLSNNINIDFILQMGHNEILNYLYSMPGAHDHLFIAGGYTLRMLFNRDLIDIGDIDVFFVGCMKDEATLYIEQFINCLTQHGQLHVVRSKNCITVNYNYTEIQFILRLYKTHTEVLSGFDIDCCCIGYNGKELYLTERALYSIINRTNTVNFDLLSPSYEYRLAKYAKRGFAVRIPNFDRTLVNMNNLHYKYLSSFGIKLIKKKYGKLQDIITRLYKNGYESMIEIVQVDLNKWSEYHSSFLEYRKSNRLKGLDLLLVLELESLFTNSEPEYESDYGYCGNPFSYNYSVNELYIRSNDRDYVTNIKSILYTVKYKTSITFDILNYINDETYEELLSIDPNLDISKNIEYKITNPGEQVIGSFNKIVLDDNSIWYNPLNSESIYNYENEIYLEDELYNLIDYECVKYSFLSKDLNFLGFENFSQNLYKCNNFDTNNILSRSQIPINPSGFINPLPMPNFLNLFGK